MPDADRAEDTIGDRGVAVGESSPSALYTNRELSSCQVVERLLDLAEDERVPLLERVKFCAIVSSIVDDFFMLRVAGLRRMIDAGDETPHEDGRTPIQTLSEIRRRSRAQVDRQTRCLELQLRPALARRGIRIVSMDDVGSDERRALETRFRRQIFPALTPLTIHPGRPFPYVSSGSLSLGVDLRYPGESPRAFGRIKVPREILPRFVALDTDPHTFVAVEEIIAANLESCFPGMEIAGHTCFRVMRDAEIKVSDDADDLLEAVEAELRRRGFTDVVRLDVGAGIDSATREQITTALDVAPEDVFDVRGLLDLSDLHELAELPELGELRDAPWTPVTHPRLQGRDLEPADVMAAMRRGDILLHHPYHSFSASVERFVEQAVDDPNVVAIKQTMYRTSDDSRLVPTLIRAAERGKQAVCVVELKARFDERANIMWARRLEEAGIHVLYGHPGLKTHAKCILVVRREGDGVRHYVHIGTGNYHSKKARTYEDFGLLTVDPEITADVADMFNYLTGMARSPGYRKLLIAPEHLRTAIIDEIDATAAAGADAGDARIVMKMNALVDVPCIAALYRASRAGVRVELNVRDICSLRPGVPGLSENIRVVSIKGRFHEHARIYVFHRRDESRYYIGSADLMPRNLDERVEVLAPVTDPALRRELDDTLERCLQDDTYAWDLQPDGSWVRRTGRRRDVHRELMSRAAGRSA
jgi:polyphosphate kinase